MSDISDTFSNDELLQAYGSERAIPASHRTYIDVQNDTSVRPSFTKKDYYSFRPHEDLQQASVKEKMFLSGEAYDNIGIIKNVIDLMSDFGSQGINIVHPNSRNEVFLQRWFKRVGGVERSERFLSNLYLLGNVVIQREYAAVDENLKNYISRANKRIKEKFLQNKNKLPISYLFTNPLMVDVTNPIEAITKNSPKYALRKPKSVGSDNNSAQYMGQNITMLTNEDYVELSEDDTLVYSYKKNDWEIWGKPTLHAILDDLLMLEKMKLADMAALDGAISNVRHWKVGFYNESRPADSILPTPKSIKKWRNILAQHGGGGTLDLITGPEIDFKESNSQVYRFLGTQKYEPVLNNIYAGLGIPPTLTGLADASGGFTNNFISLKTLIERLEYGRTLLMDFWENELRIIQHVMGFRSAGRLRFDHMMLSNEEAEKSLLIQLADRDLISTRTLLERFKEDPKIEKSRIKAETKEREDKSTPPKASPYHNPQTEHELIKLAITRGLVSLKDAGLDVEERPIPEEQPDKKFKPVGRPEDGRPKLSRDKQKRKQKVVNPRSKAELFDWAMEAQEAIKNIATPAILANFGKRDLRSITKSQTEELEMVKFGILSCLEPYQEIDNQTIIIALKDMKSLSDNDVYKCYQDYIRIHTSNKAIAIKFKRILQVIAFCDAKYEK